MYTILTKASVTKLLVFTGMQISVASSSTCPSQLAPIDQTSNICTKLIKTQVGCITNVDSYSLYVCTYVASVRDISTIVCYDQVLFVEVTKLLRFLEEEKTNIFAASGFHKIPRIIYCACALTTIRYWKITRIWVTVKLGDTLAFLVKPCCSCRTNSTTTFIFRMLQPCTLF